MTFRNYYETRVHFWRMSPLCRIVVHIFLVSLTFSCHRDGFLKCLSNLDIEKYGEANNFCFIFKFWTLSFFRGGSYMITYSGFWYLKYLRPTYFCCPKGVPKILWHLTTEFHCSETKKNNPHHIHSMKSFLKESCTYFLHCSAVEMF